MSRTPVATDRAPAAIGPYSQAIATDTLLFTSGVIPIDPATGAIAAGDIEQQAHQALRNLAAVAEAAGTGLDRAVKVTVFLTDLTQFQRVNAVYARYFAEPYPARSTVQAAALPLGAAIEIEAVIAL